MYYTYSSTGQQSDAGLAQCPCVPPPADTNYPCASSCSAHDQDNPQSPVAHQCNSAADRDQYRFCSAKWCYVDAITCGVAHEVSKIANGHVYSYATCGFPDYYTSSKDLVLMRNDILRAVFIESFDGYQVGM